jgi:predicted GIY-YIG superfamily endonuclease
VCDRKDNYMRGIYMIRNTHTGDCYVGKANDIENRWAGHKAALRHGRHYSEALQTDWMIFGEEAFEFLLVTKVSSADSLQNAEAAMLE